MATPRHGPARFPSAQTTLLSVGAVYLLWGIVGFFFLGDPTADLAGHDTNHGVLGLETNGVQNLVHVAVGLVALLCTSNETALRVGGIVMAVVGFGLAAAGVAGLVHLEANVLSQNLAVTLVHAVTGLVGLFIARAPIPTPEGQESGDALGA
jgi:hypothetical protein